MTVILGRDPFDGADAVIAPAAPVGFSQSFALAWRQSQLLNQTNSRDIVTREALDTMHDVIGGERIVTDYSSGDPAEETNAQRRDRMLQRVRAARARDTHAYPGMPDSTEKFDAWVASRVQKEAQEIGGQLSRDSASGLGAFAGGVGASFTDPVNIILLPFGAARGASLLRTMLTEAAIGAGATTLAAPMVADWRDKVGLPYTPQEFLENLAFSATGGAVFGGAVKVAPKVAAKLGKISGLAGKKLLAEFDALKSPDPEALAARDLVQQQIDTLESNPLFDVPAAREEHATRLQEAVQAISESRATRIPDRPLLPAGGVRAFNGDDLDRIARSIEPEAFSRRELLQGRQETFRRWLGELEAGRAASDPEFAARAAELAQLRQKLEAATPRLAKKYQARIEALEAENTGLGDSPDMARVRQDLMRTDEQLRDLGPAIAAANRRAKEFLDQEIVRHDPALDAPRAEILDHAVRTLRRAGVTDPHAKLRPLVEGEAPSFNQVARGAATAEQRQAVGEALAAQAQSAREASPPAAPRTGEPMRAGDGGPQTSAQARLETFSDPGRGGAQHQAEQLEIAAAEDLERAPDAPDLVPVDPLTGDAAPTKDLLEEFKRDKQAVDYLKACVPGGAA